MQQIIPQHHIRIYVSIVAILACFATVPVFAQTMTEVETVEEYTVAGESVTVTQSGDTVSTNLAWRGEDGLTITYDTKGRSDEVLTEEVSFGDGGFKVDILLSEKPDTNTFCYNVGGYENYDFFYQPALTPEEIAAGDYRPPEIVGSYAVYHKTLKDHVQGGENYGTGKVMHIPRPQVWELGNEDEKVWADLSYNEGKLCVTAPQEFIDTANYENGVRIDPTFGYQTIGATTGALSTDLVITQQFTPTLSGTVEKVFMYESSGSNSLKGIIGTDSGGSPADFVTNGVGDAASTTAGWNPSPYTTQPSITAGTPYHFGYVFHEIGVGQTAYDSGTGTYVDNFDYDNPVDFVSPSSRTRVYSIYVQYAATANVSGFGYCRALTMNASQIATTTTGGFALVATNTLASLAATSSSGKIETITTASGTTTPVDFRITSDSDCFAGDGTHVEYYFEKYISTTGQFVLWLEAPDVSSTTDKTLYMYYGSSTAEDMACEECVFGALGEVGVWNLHENPTTAGAGGMLDSTSHNNNGTPSDGSGGAPSTTPGVVDGAVDFERDEKDVITVADSASLDVTDDTITMMAWVKQESSNSAMEVVNKLGASGQWSYGIEVRNATPYIRISTNGSSLTDRSGGTLTVGEWGHITGVYDGANVKNYFDGSFQAQSAKTGNIFNSTAALHIGSYLFSSGNRWDGLIDDMRIFETALTSADIETIYNNTNNSSTFWTVGAEETPPVEVVKAITITGTLYENDGVTPITTSKNIKMAVGTSTPSVSATTTDTSGFYRFQTIATSSVEDATWATTSAAGDNDNWRDLVYGNGLFVAIGDSGDRVMTSPDGITWTARSAAGDNDAWQSVVYGNNTFVAVGSSGDRVMTSPDGITWTARSAAGNDDNWRSITYGNGLFVAVGNTSGGRDAVITSPDGITWTARSAAGDNDIWNGVTYSNGTFVAVGSSGDRVMTSPDGITWTTRSAAGDDDHWRDVIYGDGLYVAVGILIGDRVMTSPDGITWATTTAAGDNDYWESVVYVNGHFVAMGYSGDRVMTSPDGITWATTTAAGDNDQWYGAAYGSGKMVAVGISGDRVMHADAGFGEDTPITVYLDGETEDATTVTYGVNGSGTSTISGIDLWQNAVRLQHSSTSGSIDLANADFYDSDDDADILFDSDTATTTINGDFIVASNTTLFAPQHLDIDSDFVLDSSFEAERGEVITTNTGTQSFIGTFGSTSPLYDLTLTGSGTTTLPYELTILGDFANTGATLFPTGFTSTFTFAADESQSISGTLVGDSSLPDVYFTGTGTKSFLNNASTTWIDISASSTVVAPSSLTLSTGSFLNNGTFTANSGVIFATSSATSTLGTYTGTSFDTAASGNDASRGITYANGYFYVIDHTDDEVYQYELDGTYTGTSFDTAGSGNDSPIGITYANGYFYVADYNDDKVYQYDASGTYTGTTFDTAGSGNGDSRGVTYANGYFYIVDNVDDEVYQYDASGTYTGTSFDTAASGNTLPYGITYANGHFYVVDDTRDEVYQYSAGRQTFSGNLTGTSALNNIEFLGQGTKELANSASTTGTFTAADPGGTIYFTANTTNTIGTLVVTGAAGDLVKLHSTVNNTDWNLVVDESSISYANVDDSNACSGETILYTAESTVTGSHCWLLQSGITITGTLYASDNVTPLTGKTVAAGVGTSTKSKHVATVDSTSSGTYTITGIATSTGGEVWEVASAAGNDDSWFGVTYGNGLFVAVGNTNDRVMTSPDGETWTARSAAGDDDAWLGVTYGGGVFVAVSSTGDRAMYSYDGITWATTTIAGDDDSWRDVTYGNGRFVAIASAGDMLATSPDGITWTARSVAGDDDAWRDVTYGNGTFVAVGSTGDRAMYSYDGITWATTTAAGDNDQWYDVAYGNGLFVAAGINGDVIMTSPDGITWTARSAAGDDDDWVGLAFANGRFVAVSGGLDDRVIYSDDGINWSTTTAAGDNDVWRDIAYGNGRFVAVGASTEKVMYSDAGIGEQTPITLYLDGETEDATTLTYGLNGTSLQTILYANLYQNRVQLQHSSTSGVIHFANAHFFDSDNDADILFDSDTATTTISGADLLVASNTTLYAPQHLDTDNDLTIEGGFEHERGEVILTGTNQSVLSDNATTTFYDFTKEVSSANTLTLSATSTLQFKGTLNLSGIDGNLLSLRSSNDGTQAEIQPYSSVSVSYLDVKDSNNISATTTPIECAIECVNSGNTTGWNFSVTSSTTLADSSAGQADNAFQFKNQTQVPAFTFRLTPLGEHATVTSLTVNVSNISRDVDSSSIQNLALYRDNDSDGVYDATDTALDTTGVFTFSNQTGTIEFNDDFLATTSKDYLIVFDTNDIDRGESMTFNLTASSVVATGVTSGSSLTTYGSVSAVHHVRGIYGGGAATAQGAVGGEAPAGREVISGGNDEGGGEVGEATDGANIASHPNYFAPSSNGGTYNQWTNPDNVHASDGIAANAASDVLRQSYDGFGFNIPTGNTVTGIEVKVDASDTVGSGGLIKVALSWDNGVSSTTLKQTSSLATSDAVYELGGSTDTWGRTWSPSEFLNANFEVIIESLINGGSTNQVDGIEVRVYHQATGGGSGGGGSI